MKNISSSLIIGVDAGYGNMKTARSIFPTGLIAMDTEPMFEGDIMKYNGFWTKSPARRAKHPYPSLSDKK